MLLCKIVDLQLEKGSSKVAVTTSFAEETEFSYNTVVIHEKQSAENVTAVIK